MQSPKSEALKISSRVTLLEPGMYIFRYASQPAAEKRVYIALQQAPLGKGVIDFFPAEGVSKNILTKLGDCIIGRVKGGVTTVLITEYHLASDVDPVDLRIDRIDTSVAIMRNLAPAAQPAETDLPPEKTIGAAVLKLTGHIEQTGDVAVTGDQWLGNEAGQARLEGFAITWENKPRGVDLAYSTTIAGAGPSQKVTTGGFTGARNKMAFIIAVGFGLTGPERARYELTGHVVFAGGGRQPIVADQMIFGSNGNEPLVALQLSITPKTEINALRHTSLREKPAVTQTDSNIGQLA